MAISSLDLTIIILYLVGILTVGILSTRKGKITGKVFFLAGRSLKWWIVGIALFASNISTIHLVGFAASGYNEGLVWGNFEFMLQAWWLFCICSLIYVVVSLLTPPPAREEVEGLTWDHPLSVLTEAKLSGITDPRALAGLLVVTLATLYYLFR